MNEILKLVNEISEIKMPNYKLLELLSCIERDVLELIILSGKTLTIDQIKTTIYEHVKTGTPEFGIVKLDFGGFFERDVNGLALFDVTLHDGTVIRVNENLEYTDDLGNVLVVDMMDIKTISHVFTISLNQSLYDLFSSIYYNIYNSYKELLQIDSFRIYVKNVLSNIEQDPSLTDKYVNELKTIKQNLEVK